MTLASLGIMLNTMNQVTHGRVGDYMESIRLMNKIYTKLFMGENI